MEANQHNGGKIKAWLKVVRLDINGLILTINDLKNTLPQVDSTTTASSTEYRVRCNLPLQINGGIFGTLMGWCNNRRLNNLREQLHEVQGNQNQLLQVQTVAIHKVDELEKLMSEVIYELHYLERIVTQYWSLEQVQQKICFNIQKLIRALQAAQQQRLSIDLLSSTRLQDLFDAATVNAKAHHHQLLIRHPSNLLQIEASYIHDGVDVNLILHIPMAPADSILRLFQLHPFP
jgi:hypothetical protein